MNVSYYYATEYNKHGCYFHGNLLVFEVVSASTKENRNKPVNGWGQCTVYDIIDTVKEWLKENDFQGDILLSIPDLVFRLRD